MAANSAAAVRGDRTLLLDLGQPGGHLARHLFRGEGRLGQALMHEVEPVGQVMLGDVELDRQAGVADAAPDRHPAPFEQARELHGGMPRGPLIEGPRHDGGDAFEVARLDPQRHGHRQTHRQDVLSGQVIGQPGRTVGQPEPGRHRELVGLRHQDVGAG